MPRSSVITGALAVLTTIVFTVYGQLILKWQVGRAGDLPSGTGDKVEFFLRLIVNPWMLTAWAGLAVAAAAWMLALTKFELSRAYPFMSTTFVLVLIGSAVFFGEGVSTLRIVGMALIVGGLVVGSQG
jgi:multidrug transporter EmrE-like cation transporter